MPEPGLRPSTGITRLLRYHEPLRLPQRPKAGHFRPPGWWPRPTTAMDLARCLEDLAAHADPTTPAGEGGFSGRLLPRPPTAFPFWQEGRLQRETIEACSGFNFLSACALAPWLRQGLPRRLQPGDLSPRLLQWLPGEPTIPRTGLAPAGLRDPGGLSVI